MRKFYDMVLTDTGYIIEHDPRPPKDNWFKRLLKFIKTLITN